MKDEMILVVRRALFDQLGAFQGLNFQVNCYLPALLDRVVHNAHRLKLKGPSKRKTEA